MLLFFIGCSKLGMRLANTNLFLASAWTGPIHRSRTHGDVRSRRDILLLAVCSSLWFTHSLGKPRSDTTSFSFKPSFAFCTISSYCSLAHLLQTCHCNEATSAGAVFASWCPLSMCAILCSVSHVMVSTVSAVSNAARSDGRQNHYSTTARRWPDIRCDKQRFDNCAPQRSPAGKAADSMRVCGGIALSTGS